MNLTAHDPARSRLPGIVTVPQTVVDASGLEETGADLTVEPPELATMTQVPPLSDTVVTKAEPESTDPEAFQLTPGEKSVAGANAGDDGAADGDGAADTDADGDAGGLEGPVVVVPGAGEADAVADADGEEDGRVESLGFVVVFVDTQLVSKETTARAVIVAPQKFRSVFARMKARPPVPKPSPGTRWPNKMSTIA